MDPQVMVVSSVSDDPFAIDVAHFFGQRAEISDLLSLKRFANSEFCPRFISDEDDYEQIGHRLDGKTVVIVCTCCGDHTRNALTMRTALVARAAKDNGAEAVVLVEPDLFFSAQDRGPRPDHGEVAFARGPGDFKKFDGQPFSARLYAQLLHVSGIDEVVTVHNHSVSVQRLFAAEFGGSFSNLCPDELYANYLLTDNINGVLGRRLGIALCAPDAGARGFVGRVHEAVQQAASNMLLAPSLQLLFMEKKRTGERQVEIGPAADSPLQMGDIAGRDIVVFDDMVRTGSTIVSCCQQLKEAGANRVVFVVTHFYSSPEVKENLNTDAIDEIVTTNTLPTVLNRDMQGRLRKKMLVLKIEEWMADFLLGRFGLRRAAVDRPLYSIDISSKNPRSRQ